MLEVELNSIHVVIFLFFCICLAFLFFKIKKEEAGGEQDLKGNQCDDQSLGNNIFVI